MRDRLERWVRGCGYETRFTDDAEEAIAWSHQETFAASFLDSEMGAREGRPVWRVVRPLVGRRLVLMARGCDKDLWFEALRSGVATVLPLPPEEPMVRAALTAVTRGTRWDDGPGQPTPRF